MVIEHLLTSFKGSLCHWAEILSPSLADHHSADVFSVLTIGGWSGQHGFDGLHCFCLDVQIAEPFGEDVCFHVIDHAAMLAQRSFANFGVSVDVSDVDASDGSVVELVSDPQKRKLDVLGFTGLHHHSMYEAETVPQSSTSKCFDVFHQDFHHGWYRHGSSADGTTHVHAAF